MRLHAGTPKYVSQQPIAGAGMQLVGIGVVIGTIAALLPNRVMELGGRGRPHHVRLSRNC